MSVCPGAWESASGPGSVANGSLGACRLAMGVPPSAAQDQVDRPYCLGEAVLAGQAGLCGDGVAAVTVIAYQRAEFAGEVLGALAAPREGVGDAQPGHPDRGLGLVKASRDDHLRQPGPEQRDRCPDAAVVDGGLAAGGDPGQRCEAG